MKFRNILIGFVLLFVASFGFADEGGFYIENYDFDVLVRSDASLDISHKVDVFFTQPRHGIYVWLPSKINISRTDKKGRTGTYYYEPSYKIEVQDDTFEKTEDGIRIGSESRLVKGKKTYNFWYNYKFGDDKFKEYDELYYSLIGSGWNCNIKNVTFKIQFENETDLSDIKFYSGISGSEDGSKVIYEINGSTVTGYIQGGLKPGEAFTVFKRFEEGYFDKVEKKSTLLIWFALLFGTGVFAFALYRMISINSENSLVKTVEFKAPEDFTSAEVGYAIDESADQKDLTSLIVWFACEGYIEIVEDEKKKTKLKKIKDLPSHSSKYLKTMFDALLVDKFDEKKRGEVLYEAVQKAKRELKNTFAANRELVDSERRHGSIRMMALGIISMIFAVLASSYNCQLETLIIFSGFHLFFTFVYCGIAGKKLQPVKIVSKARIVFLYIFFVLGLCAYLFITRNFIATNIWILFAIPYSLGALSLIWTLKTNTASEYKTEVMGKLLGFKDFIKTAELEKLEALCKDDPQYFYSVLPYAYVFGLTDTWIKQFEKLVVPPPSYYHGAYNAWNVHHFVRGCNSYVRGVNLSIGEYQAQKTASSVSHGGSGGGHSGGGFGGGGGGSW